MYVGSGQLGDWAASEAASYRIAVETAEEKGDQKALAALRDIGPPPHTGAQLWIQRTTLQQLEGALDVRRLWRWAKNIIDTPETSLWDAPRDVRAFKFCLDHMWPVVTKLNLLESVPALDMPGWLLLGRQDHWVPAECSQAWFDTLEAPFKEIVWFESSGHQPFVDEPEAFERCMRQRIRPRVRTRVPTEPTASAH